MRLAHNTRLFSLDELLGVLPPSMASVLRELSSDYEEEHMPPCLFAQHRELLDYTHEGIDTSIVLYIGGTRLSLVIEPYGDLRGMTIIAQRLLDETDIEQIPSTTSYLFADPYVCDLDLKGGLPFGLDPDDRCLLVIEYTSTP